MFQKNTKMTQIASFYNFLLFLTKQNDNKQTN